MKLLSIGGTRPQFVKMAVIARVFEDYSRLHPGAVEHRLLHTGQHRDPGMSDIFFRELGMPAPRVLDMSQTRSPGLQTAIMLAEIEEELRDYEPDAVIVYGDTNSTIASALAAAKIQIPIVHLEAGLRSFNRCMQEEINRIVTDHVSDLLLCPTHAAVDQLKLEGLGCRAVFVGDVMLDAVELFGRHEQDRTTPRYPQQYAVVTLHRAEMVDHPERLAAIFDALRRMETRVVFPMHPRLRQRIAEMKDSRFELGDNVHVVEPVGYLEMLELARNASFLMTDSGGLQKEAYFLGVPCLTVRNETEWEETLIGGWNTLVGWDTKRILAAVEALTQESQNPSRPPRNLAGFGDGNAGKRSVEQILKMVGAA